METKPTLAGLRILDLADEKASFCSKLLADMGAEVIKVEKPGGDLSRWSGPFWGDVPHPEKSLSFWYNNSSKLGITLNLESEEGQEIFRRLSQRTDVIVETFRPGYLKGVGLSYELLSKTNPGLILVSVTGFGQSGPYREYKSCDIVASALGGQMYVCGALDTAPLKPYGQQAYYVASLFAAIGILLALHERKCSGKGQHIDISLQETVAATLEHVLIRYFHEGVVSQRRGSLHWNNSFCVLPCKDGYIALSPLMEWETLVEWLDSEGMVSDLKEDQWQDGEYRSQHVGHIIEVLKQWTETHTTTELFEMGQLMRLPWAPVASPPEVLNSPQLKARDFFVSVAHPEANTYFTYPGAPCRYSHSSWNIQRRAPLIGEHNAQVYHQELVFSQRKLDRLSSRNAIQTMYSMSGDALQELRVLDFTWVLAGPYATRILADFGAEVIKVQSRKTARGAELNNTGYFNTWNRNKLGITLDLSRPEGRDLALKLVKISDVVIENFTPRVMANWGLEYENLKEVKPDLIMLSMSGMGQTGPWRDFTAFGYTIQAISGITYLTSISPDKPIGLSYSYADHVAGLYAALAILAAFEHRDRTGEGQYIDISEYEAMCTLLGPAIMDYAINHNPIIPRGNHPDYALAAPYGCYKCHGDDRWCVIAVFTEKEWQALCDALGNPSWTKEAKFSTLQWRKEHAEELNELLEQWTIKHRPEVVMDLLQRVGVAAGVVKDAREVAEDPQLAARNFFVEMSHPVLGQTKFDSTPIRLGRTPAQFRRGAPLLGQDNSYVYQKLLGIGEQELAKYTEQGVIS